MKKNKPVEVEIREEVVNKDGESKALHQLFIGKRLIGEVLEMDGTKFEVKGDDGFISFAKTMDQGYEEVLRNWNLHN